MKYLNFKLLIFFLTALLAFGVGWAGTVTFDLSNAASTGGTVITSLAQDGVTLTFSKGSGNAPAWYSGVVRIYKEGSLEVISPDKKIVGIDFTGSTASTTVNGGLANWTPSTGSYTIIKASSPATASWTGSVNYVQFNVANDKRVYLTKIVVTTEDGDPTPGKTDVDLEFSSSTATATLGESFTAPTLSVDPSAASSAVAYSSSNTAVATVASDGTVTPVAAGTTTITASISNNATYNDASASYELTVVAGSQPGGGKLYVKVTDESQMEVGKKYILVYNNLAMGALTNSGGGYGAEVQVAVNSDGSVNIDNTNALELILGKNSANRYTFNTQDGYYLTAVNNNNLYTNATSDDSGWNVTPADGGYGVTSQASSNTRAILHRDGYTFRHYAVSNANNSGYGWAKLYVESGGSNRVATPTFSPDGGAYDEQQNVTISCETPNSTIYYTTDGSTPDENSTLYTGAINVSETTTIKAIAVASGMDNSYVASATYTLPTFVANLAGANALDAGTNFKFTNNAVVVYNTGTNMWIQDENATAGGGLIFKQGGGLDFEPSNIIAANWTAKVKAWQGFNEFEDFSGTKTGGSQNPVIFERTTITDDNIHEYVRLRNVTITKSNNSLYVTLPDSRAQMLLYTTQLGECTDFTPDANKTYDLEGIVGSYQSNLQIYPTKITEYVAPGNPSIIITSPETLPFNDEGGVYTVNATFLPDGGLGVSVSDGFSRYLINGDNTYYYFEAPNIAETGHTVTGGQTRVEYTGRELSATGTITYESSPVSETAELSYRADIYLYRDGGNGWGYPEDAKFDYANGIYSKTFTIEGTTYLLFSRKLGANYSWNDDRLFFGPVTDGNNWVYKDIFEDDLDVNPNGQYYPIQLNDAGEYTITVNPTAKTFTINKVVHQVETPVISPEGGNYNTIQTVTITAVNGATIHYTTDGSVPTESSTLYEGPITVDQSMTIKAIAVMDGMDNSEVAEATYTLPTSVNTLAAANKLVKDTEFLFTGDAVVTYHNGDYTFLRDVNATAGGGLIYQSGINLAQGVVLKKGWDAKRDDYRGEKEYVDAINVESSGSTADYTPFNRTGVVFDDTHMNEYVTFNNVTITGKTLDEGSGKYTYTGTYSDDNRVTVNYTLHNQFDLTNIEEGRTYNVTGVVTKRDENMQVYPTAVTLVQQDPNMSFAEQNVNATFGADFNEPALTKPEGVTVTYSSSDPTVAEVDATTGEVTIKKVGNATITATSVANEYYTSGTASYNIVVTAGTPTFAYSAPTATAVFGETATLPTLNNPNGLGVTYTSSNQAVATVNAQGEVTIVGAGTTVITATGAATGNYSGAEAQYTLTVTAGTPTFAYSAPTATAVFGETATLPTLDNPNSLTVTYSSSNQAVATVNENGEVTIVGAGTTTITATGAATGNYSGAEAQYTLTVTAGTPTFAYSAPTATAVFGETATLPTLDNPNNLTVTYSSSAPAVATVNDNGEVTIVGIGETVIKAVGAATGNYSGAEAQYTLTVTAGTPTFAYSAPTATAVFGETATLPTLDNPNNLTVTYSSSNQAVATVNENGEVTIVGIGETVIKAVGAATGNYAGAESQYTLTVTAGTPTFAYSAPTASAVFGETATLPTLNNPNGLGVTYTSSAPAVATVNDNGEVTIVGAGTTTITATGAATGNYNGATATYTLTVTAGTPTFAYSAPTATAVFGETATLPTLDNPNGLTVTYTSSAPAVATVNDNGEVTIVGAGTTTITATGAATGNYNGATATYTLTVTKAQATLTFAKGTINATIGGEVEANPLTNEANLTVTYSSSNTAVATVDATTGKVTIVGTGSAIITATGEDNANYLGTTATYTINVAAADAITFTLNTDVMNYTVGDEVKVKVDNVQNAIGDYTITYKIGDTELVPDENDYVTIPTAEVGTVTLTVTVKDAYEHSTEATQNFVFNIAAADAITFTLTPDGGEYTVGDKVNVKVSNIQNTIGDYTITYTTNFTREPQTYDPEQGIDITSDEAGQVNLTVTVTDAYEHTAEGTKSAVYKFAAAPAIEITLNPDGGEYIVGDVVNVTVAVDKTLGDYTVVYQIDGGEAQEYDAATGIVITRSTVGNVDLKVTVTDGYEHEGDGTASATYVFKPVPVVAAPTFSLASGTYDTPQDVTITGPEGATIYYSVDGGLTWTEGNSLNMTETTILMAKAVKDGIESPVVTNAYVIEQTVERIPVEPIDGYFSIKNNGNNKYANVQGRKTLTFCDDAAKEAQAGTVIYVNTDEYGQVQSLRSQAADLQGYADRAMRYVPEVVQLVVDKLHATGVGSLLGEDGYDAIMEKFNESFDYHLYVEKDGENYRIYGKTPSMQPVVDFYAENMSRVDEKLPMLEGFINDAIDKVLNKMNGHGASILVDYDLEEVWQRMGGNLTKPEDEASTMAFYRQVLCNKDNVWNFAYQSVMIYWERLKNHDLYEQMKEELGEFANYVDKLEQVLPDMKYYIVADGNKVDYISAGNGDIINGAARTYWTLVPRTTFTKNFDENNYFGCILNKKYVATLYTDFAYTLPEDVKAYKVTRVSANGLATLEALSGAIPAQTPVLLMSEESGDKVLNLSTTGTADMEKNLLVGPDYLIDEYKLVTPQVQVLFDFVKQYVSEEFYNTYVTPYEHLMYKNSGTVGNKYFWGLPSSDLDLCVYTNAENSSDCVVRSLGVNEATGTFGFVDHWSVRTNEAFLVSSEVDEIKLSNKGDVNHDGVVDINDVTLTISRVLGIPTPDCCPYCADVVETGVVDIDDVTELINIVLGVR